ncbi:hypothetical protein HGRIS_003859 [Hohenbuehelia grisea]|uniref:Uncharacterized protein n=1 Tax=Hohenbuehelia grisea TaxID=104357 RepID=A0ABR3JIC1_9AGAR
MSSLESYPTARELEDNARHLLKYRRPLRTEPPDNAYGVYVTDECLLRFGRMMYRQHGWAPDPDPAIEKRKAILFAKTRLPLLVQVAIPGLTLTRWRTVLVRPRPDSPWRLEWLLVLSDDQSAENRKMKNTVEIEERLLRFLQIDDQKPAWYAVCTGRWCVVFNFPKMF